MIQHRTLVPFLCMYSFKLIKHNRGISFSHPKYHHRTLSQLRKARLQLSLNFSTSSDRSCLVFPSLPVFCSLPPHLLPCLPPFPSRAKLLPPRGSEGLIWALLPKRAHPGCIKYRWRCLCLSWKYNRNHKGEKSEGDKMLHASEPFFYFPNGESSLNIRDSTSGPLFL